MPFLFHQSPLDEGDVLMIGKNNEHLIQVEEWPTAMLMMETARTGIGTTYGTFGSPSRPVTVGKASNNK
jgi:hypothetical protein